MKTSEKIKAGKKLPGRAVWHGLDPRTKVVRPKKGKGAYRRSTMRGLERRETSEARDLFRHLMRNTGVPDLPSSDAVRRKEDVRYGKQSSGTPDPLAAGL